MQTQQQDPQQGRQHPNQQDDQRQQETWWEQQQQEEGYAGQDEPEDYNATWAAGTQQEERGQEAQQGASDRQSPSEGGDDARDSAQRPLFFARFTAGWLYASMGTVAASILEKRRDYAAAVDLLRLLLGGNACPARRGAWWTRLSINLEHMKVSKIVQRACGLCPYPGPLMSYFGTLTNPHNPPHTGSGRCAGDGRGCPSRRIRSSRRPAHPAAARSAAGTPAQAVETPLMGGSSGCGAVGGACRGTAARWKRRIAQQVRDLSCPSAVDWLWK